MDCNKCKETYTIKATNEWITIMCKCQCLIVYPDGFIVRKEKKDYKPNYKESLNS